MGDFQRAAQSSGGMPPFGYRRDALRCCPVDAESVWESSRRGFWRLLLGRGMGEVDFILDLFVLYVVNHLHLMPSKTENMSRRAGSYILRVLSPGICIMNKLLRNPDG